MSENTLKNLTLLGSSTTDYPQSPDEAKLEVIPNNWKTNDYVVNLNCHEFTCLCPKTAQPDFGNLIISYIPGDYLVESKALKLYLFSYRNHGIFHEFVSNKIANDLFEAMKPKALYLKAEFMPRGGIAIHPEVYLGDQELAKSLKN